jgi:hypothetical protein
MKAKLHVFRTSAPDRVEWSVSRFDLFIWGKNHRCHWIGGQMGPKVGLEMVEGKEIIALYSL